MPCVTVSSDIYGLLKGTIILTEATPGALRLHEPRYTRELEIARRLARDAGAAALRYYGNPDLNISHKYANEPVTEADFAANNVIVPALRRAFPADGILSEETPDVVRHAPGSHLDESRLDKERVWMIDPLDGTRGFIDGTGDFAVQIGLCISGKAALGVVYKPVDDVLYSAARGAGAWVEHPNHSPARLHVSDRVNLQAMRLAASRSHRSPRMDKVIAALGVREEVRRGSVGIKVGLIVEGACDLYVHLSPMSRQWDTCAPEAILREAGGQLTDIFGNPFRYNTIDIGNHNGIVATNGAAHREVIERLAPLLAEFGRVPAQTDDADAQRP